MKNKFLPFIIAATILLFPQGAGAQTSTVSSTDFKLPNIQTEDRDYRVKILSDYLKEKNSPLAPYAGNFVAQADKYNLDWKLVAAISGVESTFGQAIPQNSYNGWGWGVYGTNVIRFNSWNDGINTVSEGLRKRYMNEWGGQNIYQIGAMYASSKAWPNHVNYYLNDIQDFALRNPQDTLSLSL